MDRREIKTNIGLVNTYPRLIMALALLELIVSIVFYSIGFSLGNAYFRGVGVGLTIAWATTLIAYFIVEKRS